MDKSVDTFEQNKLFLAASSRSFKKKNIFFDDSQPPYPPFQCCNTLRGHFHVSQLLLSTIVDG